MVYNGDGAYKIIRLKMKLWRTNYKLFTKFQHPAAQIYLAFPIIIWRHRPLNEIFEDSKYTYDLQSHQLIIEEFSEDTGYLKLLVNDLNMWVYWEGR